MKRTGGVGARRVISAVGFVILAGVIALVSSPDPVPGQAAATGPASSVLPGHPGVRLHPAANVPAESPLSQFRLPHEHGRALSPNQPNFAGANLEGHADSSGPLLLFLAATGEPPSNYQSFLTAAIAAGYNVLGLDYWNIGHSVTATCGSNSRCYTSVQRNRFDGSDPTPASRVSAPNSILNRLRMALTHLQTSDPAGGWERYSSGSDINWSNIVLAGHSQGGGESAYIAHLHAVRGVLMFSSPVETDAGIAASWMKDAGATPASREYGFVNHNDMFEAKILGSWRELALSGPGAAPSPVPTGSHQLVSSLDIGTPQQSHLHTVDDQTPRAANGSPVYLPTWNWMLKQALLAPTRD